MVFVIFVIYARGRCAKPRVLWAVCAKPRVLCFFWFFGFFFPLFQRCVLSQEHFGVAFGRFVLSQEHFGSLFFGLFFFWGGFFFGGGGAC